MSLITAPDAAAAAVTADPPVVAAVAAPVAAAVADTTAALTDPAAAVVTPVVEAAAVVPPVKPEGLPDGLWDEVAGVKTVEAVTRLVELEAADKARTAGIPATAADYKLEPAEPILDPVSGKPVTFNADDPLAKAALSWAHENQVPQASLAKLLGVFAANEMAALTAHNSHVAAETAKLGANSEARFASISTALTAHAGEAGAKAIMGNLGSADAVIALEAVLKKLAGPSIGTPPAAAAKNANLADLTGVDLLSAVLK